MKKRLIAILSIMALCTTSAMPVLAAENTDVVTVAEEEIPEQNESEEQLEENVEEVVPEDKKEEVTVPEENTQEEQAEEKEISEETSDEEVVIEENEEQKTVQSSQDIPESGWYEDEWGYRYYYVNGEKLENRVYQIENAWYYFDWDGILLVDDGRYVDIEDTEQYGYLKADSEGKLICGWYSDQEEKYYYGDNFLRYEDKILSEEDVMYYFDREGKLVTNDRVYVDGVLYVADAEGVLTISDARLQGWEKMSGNWYYYEDGKPVQGCFKEIGGKTYYFDYDGVMQTGVFRVGYYDEEKNEWIENSYLAKASGVVYQENMWVEQDGAWYYLDKDYHVICDQFYPINGKTYYFDYDGVMQTGVFRVGYYDEEKNEWIENSYLAKASGVVYRENMWVEQDGAWYYLDKEYHVICDQLYPINGKTYYFDYDGVMQTGRFSAWDYDEDKTVFYLADSSGVVYKDNSWHKLGSKWVYVQANGKLYTDGKYDINNKTYIFDYEGTLQTGKVWYENEDKEFEYYGTDSNGAVVKNNWVQAGLNWYYTDKDGKILINQWLLNKYYFDASGCMVVGLQNIDGLLYSFSDNGVLLEKLGKKSGWQLVDGAWCYWDEKGQLYNGWLNGTYYLNKGVMVTNQRVQSQDGKHYSYMNYKGKVIKGWDKTSWGDWIYADAKGNLAEGWLKVDGKWYYFDEGFGNTMATYPVVEEGVLYDIKYDGTYLGAVTGKKEWKKTSHGTWYYFNEDGSLNQERKKVINGVTYYFRYDGEMVADTMYYDDEKEEYFYINTSGKRESIANGWKKINDRWYYYKDSKSITGLQTIGGKQYYFYSDGEMATGCFWVNEQDKFRFAGSDGVLRNVTTGWYDTVNYANKKVWYYFENGDPVKGLRVIGGKNYFLYGDGEMATGVTSMDYGAHYLFDANGVLVKNAWAKVDGIWYYAGSTGRVYTGERTINGKTYWFTNWGEWVK